MSGLQVVWYCLIGVLLTGYVILDGYDLGVGFWYLFAKNDSERKALLSSILPFWDGNEVWLLTGGGAVFAAFPPVYATVFSGLYLALMLVLFSLIFRAVSTEFIHLHDSNAWRRGWGIAFSLGSIVPALLFGVAMGNILRGLPLDSVGNYTGTFFTLLNPYSLLVGVTGLALFATHGALFAALRTTGELEQRAKKWAIRSWWAYLVLLLVTVVITLRTEGQLRTNLITAVPLTLMLATVLITGSLLTQDRIRAAFISSSLAIAATFITLATALFPNMVPALENPANNLTLANSSSSPLTLKTMLILALIGVPIVLVYTIWVHLAFRGKVGEEQTY